MQDKLKPIGVSGLARSGKDSFADALVRYDSRYVKDHFAGDLKRIASQLLGWDGQKDGTDVQSTKGRKLLQLLGTECGRQFCDTIWIEKVARRHGLHLPDGQLASLSAPATAMSRELYSMFQSARARHLACSEALPAAMQTSMRLNHANAAAMMVMAMEFFWNHNRLDDLPENTKAANLRNRLIEISSEYNNCAGLTAFNLSEEDFLSRIEALYSGATKETNAKQGVILPDVRFPNEFGLVAQNGGLNVKIYRPGIRPMGHPSETSLRDTPFDIVVMNDVLSLDEYSAIVDRASAYIMKRLEGHALAPGGQPIVFASSKAGFKERYAHWDLSLREAPDLMEEYNQMLSLLSESESEKPE